MSALHLAQIAPKLDTLEVDAAARSQRVTGVEGGVRCSGCGAYALKPLAELGWKRTILGPVCSADECRGGSGRA